MNKEDILKKIRLAKEESTTELDLSGDQIYSLPPEIGELTELISLNLGTGSYTTFIGIGYGETDEFESSNYLSMLPPEIGNLKKLKSLNLKGNKLESLPVEITNLEKLSFLDLRNNPLPIPPEILEKVNEPQKIINYYFEIKRYVPSDSLEDGTLPPVIEVSKLPRQGSVKPLNEIKLILVGQGSVGKTSIIGQIQYGTYNQDQTKTEGISINKWGYENDAEVINVGMNSWTLNSSSEALKLTYDKRININIWDFGGQEIMHATHQFFLTKRSLYLLVLDSPL